MSHPSRTADTQAALLPALGERWSPRSFEPGAVVDETKLTAALEAARWSPSASNIQPWRFIVARRGTAEFDAVVATLVGFNAAWAGSASVLIISIAEVATAEGKANPVALYDLGQAVAHLSVQAQHDGIHTHQMTGFDVEAARAAFDIEQRFVPVSVTALGILGTPDALPDALREREVAPRSRLPLADLVVLSA